ncbi:MAG: hypothetical protein WCE47_11690 [Gaiella sp.]|jgi:hypothetical protein|uniref:hypothetical protein n=1 Tax=Gaiella sp. TaxID=2663207 RepID=UPI002C3A8C3B|nr:hypothetical protein [Gaiella sp.]
MASRKRKKTIWTSEDEARVQRTARLVRERIAYHSEMSRLLGEREREHRRLEELRRSEG